MANITEESKGLEALLAAANKQDKEKPVVNTFNIVCELDNEDCEACGS